MLETTMRRMMLGALMASAIGLGAAATAAGQVDTGGSHKKEIEALNRLTGLEPLEGMLQQLLDRKDKESVKGLVQAALPLAKNENGLTYNAALVLAMLAADQKDLKACDAFFHVCAAHAVKEQSTRKLAQSYGALIQLYYENKKYAECARVCREVLALKTEDGKERIVYKAYTDDHGDTDFNEYAAFESARALQPRVLRYLMLALARQGKYDQAIKIADSRIKDEDDWEARRDKAAVLREAGEYAQAAAIFEDVIKRVNSDSTLDAKDKEEFVELLRAELSNVYVDLKQVDKAAAQLEMLLKQRPDDAGYHNDLGYILADHDMRLDEAEALIRKALELDKAKRKEDPGYNPKTDHDKGAYLDSLGWVLYKKKELKAARKYLEMAIEDKAAQHIEIYDHLGDVCLAQGDREAAIRAWEDGLKHATDSRRDQRIRGEVQKKLESVRTKSASK
jgi:tetratricopeptide (TPR) repeat protein